MRASRAADQKVGFAIVILRANNLYVGMPWITLLAAPIGLPAAFATADGAEHTFKEHYGRCHARAASAAREFKENTEQRRKVLDEFLTTHHAEDCARRLLTT
jgi:hypothetical protein